MRSPRPCGGTPILMRTGKRRSASRTACRTTLNVPPNGYPVGWRAEDAGLGAPGGRGRRSRHYHRRPTGGGAAWARRPNQPGSVAGGTPQDIFRLSRTIDELVGAMEESRGPYLWPALRAPRNGDTIGGIFAPTAAHNVLSRQIRTRPMARNARAAALALHRFGLGPRAGAIEAIAPDPQGALMAELDRPGPGLVAADLPGSGAANRAVFEFNAERNAKEKLARQR